MIYIPRTLTIFDRFSTKNKLKQNRLIPILKWIKDNSLDQLILKKDNLTMAMRGEKVFIMKGKEEFKRKIFIKAMKLIEREDLCLTRV